MSPALILLLFEQSEKDLAQHALLTMEITLAATGVSWLKKGPEIYRKTVERFQRMAGFRDEKTPRDDVKANRKKLLASLGKIGLTAKPK